MDPTIKETDFEALDNSFEKLLRMSGLRPFTFSWKLSDLFYNPSFNTVNAITLYSNAWSANDGIQAMFVSVDGTYRCVTNVTDAAPIIPGTFPSYFTIFNFNKITLNNETRAILLSNGGNVADEIFGIKITGVPAMLRGEDLTAVPVISQPTGKFRIAAGQSSVTVTNTLCDANTYVFCQIVSPIDATLVNTSVTPQPGGFIVTGNAAATANVDFIFHIIHPAWEVP